MTENPETPETPSENDLQSLMGGLDFTPDWAKEEPGVKKTVSHRPESDGNRRGGPRAPKRSSRGNPQGVRVKPRRDSGNRSGGGDQRNWDNRDSRSRNPRPPRPPRVPVHVDFIPEKKRLSKVVNVIRQTRRVFPLKVVAEKFMENPGFLSMKYTVKKNTEQDQDFELHICKANGMVFSDRAACEAYILEHGIEAYYDSEVKEVDPPKGAFPGIGRHTKSNRLIGPPNWHGYQPRMDEVRQEVDPTCPPELFANQVEMVRDEEVIEAWKKEVSQEIFYRPKLEEKPKEEATEASSEPSSEEASATESASVESNEGPVETESSPDTAESEASVKEAATESNSEDATETEAVEEEPENTEEQSETPTEDSEASAEPEEEAPPTEDNRPFDLTREQVEAEFRSNVMPKLMKSAQKAIMPGHLLDKMTDPSLLSSTRYHLKRESERPNSIIFALRPAFKHMRLKVYRYEGQLMVSSVEPHPLPDDLKVTPEIRQILDYVSNNPHCNAKEALEAIAKESTEVTPDLVSHFRWLIEKGHLIEFHDEKLLVPAARSKKGQASKD